MGNPVRISVIIPNHNGGPLLAECLDSLAAQTRLLDQVVVVDNGSRDGSAAMARAHPVSPRVIELGENQGFAAAVNAGIEVSDTEAVALLNNDAVADPRWVEAGLEAMQEYPRASLFASLILDYNDRDLVDSAGDIYPPDGRPLPRGRGRSASGFQQVVEVMSPCAGAAFYRRDLFRKVGVFEESFFAYLEDVDLGLRARARGHVCLFIPAARVYHRGAATDLGDRPGKKPVDSSERVLMIARNRIRVMARNWPAKALARRAVRIKAGLLRSAAYHLAVSGQGLAFVRGLFQGFSSWGADREYFHRTRAGADFGLVELLMEQGELEWRG